MPYSTKPEFSFTPYKINYGNIPSEIQQTSENVARTMENFTNFRKSLGIFTDEEKQLAEQQARERWEQREKERIEKERKERLANLEANMQAAQQRFNEEGLWNSEDVYDVYNVYETDPIKQEEFRRNGETTAGVLGTIATLPFTAGMMGGWTPAIISTITGAAGGYGGAYGGQRLGQWIDNKYGTNTTPWLSTIGGLAGGVLGGGLGYKGWEGATNQYIINKAFKSGQLKYGQPTAYTAYHQSATPITKFKFPFKERWDVRTHGADPNGAFFTVGEPAAAGFLAERPYTGQFQVKVQKPLIQTGELTGPTKNGLRNAIVRRARRDGADAVFFDGIADNQLQNQQILFAMDNADIGYRGMVGTPFKQGNWQLPRGVRNQLYNPTATERIYSILGRDPNVPTGGIQDFTTSGILENQFQPLYKFLQQHGVDTKNITQTDLALLWEKRLEAIKTASNGNYNIVTPHGSTALPLTWKISAIDPEGLVGEMSIVGPRRFTPGMDPERYASYRQNRPGANIEMIRNATRADGATMYDPARGWIQTTTPRRNPVSGVSQRLYDAGIPTAQQTNNGLGIMSGEDYLQPQRSAAVMNHYPNKIVVRNNGIWHWENLDPTKVTTRDNPVYLLTQPSGRYNHIPTKSSLFFPSAIKDGQITTNVNNGSIFLEEGGKIENPDH